MVQEKQAVFRIRKEDNVATALTELKPGKATVLGETDGLHWAQVTEPVPKGHKLALKRIHSAAEIIKYGIPIGTATAEIEPGSWVHLHCMRSGYDERSEHLNPITGVPEDISYE